MRVCRAGIGSLGALGSCDWKASYCQASRFLHQTVSRIIHFEGKTQAVEERKGEGKRGEAKRSNRLKKREKRTTQLKREVV